MPPDFSSQVTHALSLLDAQIQIALREQNLPGLSAVVIADQHILWSKGYGYADVHRRIPATPQTIYRLGSITKLFTATMLMQLRDAGKLHLDDPIERYLPEFKIRSRFQDARPTTFRQLVAHISGLPQDAPVEHGYSHTHPFPPLEQLLSSLQYFEMCLPAMTEYRYSNIGYAILGYALERVAQMPYTEYVVTQILQPLGMFDSGFTLTPAQQTKLATGYEPVPADTDFPIAEPNIYASPAGMLCSSTQDMGRFIALQFREEPAGGNQILGGSTLREMHLPVFMTTGWHDTVMIGWHSRQVAEQPVSQHSGGTPGFTTTVAVVRSLKLGMAIFTNTYQRPWDIVWKGLETLIPVFKRERADQQAAMLRCFIGTLSAYVGRYVLIQSRSNVIPEAEFKHCHIDIEVVDQRLTGQLRTSWFGFTFILLP
jgi:CubicO group peptidase (beta-lactamase class C family)